MNQDLHNGHQIALWYYERFNGRAAKNGKRTELTLRPYPKEYRTITVRSQQFAAEIMMIATGKAELRYFTNPNLRPLVRIPSVGNYMIEAKVWAQYIANQKGRHYNTSCLFQQMLRSLRVNTSL